MQNYINQVIFDLHNAKKNAPEEPDFGDNYEDFEKVMFEIETAPSKSAKEIFGVSFEELPPPNRLTDFQMQQLIDAILDTFDAFNCSAELSEQMPLTLKYELLRSCFENEIHIMPGFSMHFDFCNGDCDECKKADYCEVKDEIMEDNEINFSNDYDENKLPF